MAILPPSFPPEQLPQSRPGELISDADLEMINIGARQAAERLMVQSSAPTASESETYTIPTPVESTTSTTSSPNNSSENGIRPASSKLLKGAGIVAGAATLFAGITALDNAAGQPEFEDVDTSIESVTLEPGAIIREDPSVGNLHEKAPNNIASLDKEEIVTDVIKKEDTNNGTWYGFEANQLPVTSGVHDDDGIVWVNEQKATVKISDDSTQETTTE